MATYHINARGEAGLCRATKACPFGDASAHYESQEEARAAYELSMKGSTFSDGKSASALVTHALTTPLRACEKPSWWETYSSEVGEDFPPPELLGVVESKRGPLAVVWLPQSPRKDDHWPRVEKGIETSACLLKTLDGAEEVGSLRISFTSEETFRRAFGEDAYTPFRYAENALGHSLGVYDEEERDLTLDEDARANVLRSIWAHAHRDQRRTPLSMKGDPGFRGSWNLKEEDAPADEEALSRDLADAAKRYETQLEERKAYWNTPLPAYSTLVGEYKGQGLGATLYVYGARRLAEDGQMLKAASSRTEDALKLWDSLSKDPRLPVTEVQVRHETLDGVETVTYPALDFR